MSTRETRYHVSIAELLIPISRAEMQNYYKDLGPSENILFQWGPPIFPNITEDKVFL